MKTCRRRGHRLHRSLEVQVHHVDVVFPSEKGAVTSEVLDEAVLMHKDYHVTFITYAADTHKRSGDLGDLKD